MYLYVNGTRVLPCQCGSGGLHWSGQDIRNALGRDMTSADLFAIKA